MERLTIRNSDGSVSQPTNTTFEAAMYALASYFLTREEAEAALERKKGGSQWEPTAKA